MNPDSARHSTLARRLQLVAPALFALGLTACGTTVGWAPAQERKAAALDSRRSSTGHREALRARAPGRRLADRINAGVAPRPEPLIESEQGFDSGEVYTPKEVGVFRDVREDPLSTFAVDVDTASYAICRRKLRQGQVPQRDAVRVEEFLNVFDYGDRPPSHAPFSIHSELAESPYDSEKHLLRVALKGRVVERAERKPAHLVFLVDVSGSMRGADRIGLVKQSLRILLGQLVPGDTVAICTYSGRVATVIEPTGMDRKGEIIEALEGLRAGGSTAMGSGLKLAYALAAETYVRGHINRVIVCSDGDANVGNTHHRDILSMIERERRRGVTLSTLGFGSGNYKDVMMERLADEGNGNYSYIDSIREARRVFGRELVGTLQVIAKDVKIQVEFGPAVRSYRLIGYENRALADEDFRRDEVDAGEIGAGHRVTALYELVLARGASREADVATVRVRAKPPEGERAAEMEASAPRVPVSFARATPAFRFCVGVMGFAEILRGSPWARDWRLRTALDAARGGRIPDDAARREFIELVYRAGRLLGDRS